MVKYSQITSKALIASILFGLALKPTLAQEQEMKAFHGVHDSNRAKFSHWSDVGNGVRGGYTLEYAVCNHDDSEPLIYRWTGPNITVGRGGRLPALKCHMLARDVDAFDENRDSIIKYTQAGRNHPAAAYVNDPLANSIWPTEVRSVLKLWIQSDEESVPSLADLTLVESQTGSGVEFIFTWIPKTGIKIIYGLQGQSESLINDFIEGMNRDGYSAQITSLGNELSEADLSLVDPSRLDDLAVVIEGSPEANGPLSFEISGDIASVFENYITIVNPAGEAVVAAAITSHLLKRPE